MGYLFLILSIILLTFGHFFKAIRWKNFVDIYEIPDEKNLIRSLSFGYILNFILPFRLGDIFRVIYSGRKMKNGIAFSLGTVLLDRYIDIIVVGFIFTIFLLLGINNAAIYKSTLFYILLSLILLFIVFISYFLNKYVKILIKKISNIFNKKIRFKILKAIWSFITTFKDMIFNINKFELIIITILMWLSYVGSYFYISRSLTFFGSEVNFINLFNLFFSEGNLNFSSLTAIINLIDNNIFYLILYLILPLVILLIYTYLYTFNDIKIKKRLELIPQLSDQSKLDFLEIYFSGKNRDYINNYLKINRDILIINDCSAGSNAKTILCSYNNMLFYRKFAFNEESVKLEQQVDWIDKHKNDLSLTDITYVKRLENYFYYDMPYYEDSINYFDYIHSHNNDDNWKILNTILNDLNLKLYNNKKQVTKKSLKSYIDNKVIENINYLKSEKSLNNLLKYDYLNINGKKYRNLKIIEKYLVFDNLYEIFGNDYFSDMHGDLTIENIISSNNNEKNFYYLIDPNVNNIFSSYHLDYAKILQSLHGGYEFLSRINSVDIKDDIINYLFIKSNSYEELYSSYVKYLKDNFDDITIKSIYFHEIIHWLRLLPYKSKKDYTQFILAYSNFIIVSNEIIDMYGGDNNEK